MAIKKLGTSDFPDISTTANKVLGAAPDGTAGHVTVPVGGETLDTVVARNANLSLKIGGFLLSGSGAEKIMMVGTGSVSAIGFNRNPLDGAIFDPQSNGFQATRIGSALKLDVYNSNGSLAKNSALYVNGSGKVGMGGNENPTEQLTVAGNILASGSVSGTVFNPTSLRSRKRDIENYEGDALAEINELQLHTYHFREYEQVEKTPAVYEDVTSENGEVQHNLITPAVYEDREIIPVNQMLNVGVILDEVDNGLIADQERGVLNLNNIVFLQAKAIQQLTARLEELESK